MGYVLIALAVITTGSGLLTQYESRQVVECQTNLNQQFVEALRQRSQITAEDSANNRVLLKAIAESRSQAQVDAAIKAYLAQSVEIEKRRAAYPYPGDRCE